MFLENMKMSSSLFEFLGNAKIKLALRLSGCCIVRDSSPANFIWVVVTIIHYPLTPIQKRRAKTALMSSSAFTSFTVVEANRKVSFVHVTNHTR